MNGRMVVLAGTALFVVACRGEGGDAKREDTTAPVSVAQDPDVQLAASVARAVDAAPAVADSILTAHGLTREGLDSLMYRIAADSVKTAAYSAARR